MSANTLHTFGGGQEMTASKDAQGLLGDSNILTPRGYVPIAELQSGDRIVTRAGVRVLRELVTNTRTFRAITVGTGTLGFSRPSSDMKVAPDQEIMVRDWRAQILFGRNAVIIPAKRLVDGKFISQEAELKCHQVYELRFDLEEVFFADGVEVISKLPMAAQQAVELGQAA